MATRELRCDHLELEKGLSCSVEHHEGIGGFRDIFLCEFHNWPQQIYVISLVSYAYLVRVARAVLQRDHRARGPELSTEEAAGRSTVLCAFPCESGPSGSETP